MFPTIDLLPVVAGTILAMALGMFWFSQAGFASQWLAALGLSPEVVAKASKEGMGKQMAIAVLLTALTSIVIGNVVAGAEFGEALMRAFWLWAGLMLPISVGKVLWEKRSWSLVPIDAGYWLTVVLILAGVHAIL